MLLANPFIKNTLSYFIFDLIRSSNKPLSVAQLCRKLPGNDKMILQICERNIWLYGTDYNGGETEITEKDSSIISEKVINKAIKDGKSDGIKEKRKPTFTKKVKLWEKPADAVDPIKYEKQVANTAYWENNKPHGL